MSEIEQFPREVLAHHHPKVPLHGDFTTIKGDEYGAIDLLVGGTPCQSFSVAGLRGGMGDARGNLSLEFLRLADRTRAKWLVWENVPGVLSSNGGRDFGSILGGLVELGYGFAYRVLDAQYFGVAQRRRRVFVVGCAGSWQRAAAVLFERASLRGDTAPRRESRQRATGTLSARTSAGGGLGTDFELAGGLIQDVAPTLVANGNRTGGDRPPGTDGDTVTSLIPVMCLASGQANAELAQDVSTALTCLHEAPIVTTLAIRGRGDGRNLETRDDGLANAILTPNGGRDGIGVGAVAFNWQNGGGYGNAHDGLGISEEHTPPQSSSQVAAVAFKASHYTSGKDGAPSAVAPPLSADADKGDQDTLIAFDTTQITSAANRSNPQPGDPCHPLCAGANPPAIAFAQNQRDEVREVGVAGALAAEPGMKQQTYIFEARVARNGRGAPSDLVPPLKAQSGETGKGDAAPLLAQGMQVRRLTPRECERLQGFPDDYTLIMRGGKLAADGPRYKALGNSMAVPVMRWIGERIAMVESL